MRRGDVRRSDDAAGPDGDAHKRSPCTECVPDRADHDWREECPHARKLAELRQHGHVVAGLEAPCLRRRHTETRGESEHQLKHEEQREPARHWIRERENEADDGDAQQHTRRAPVVHDDAAVNGKRGRQQ